MEHSKHNEQPSTFAFKPFFLGLSVSALVLFSAVGGALADRLFVIRPLDSIVKRSTVELPIGQTTTLPALDTSAGSESVVVEISEQASQSVVTVAIRQRRQPILRRTPFDLFGFGFDIPQEIGEETELKKDIGTGFVVDGENSLIVTNKHVLSDPNAEYYVIDKEGKEYLVENIYRDPANDIAIIKVGANLPALTLGNSEQLKVGQSVIAIGTALGEFRHTVTTGVISGLGRGIYAGDIFGALVERIDGVIQTDAAINPGNSGGPLLNTRGQVIGVNVAVAGNAQNIGFAIPINVIKESLDNFQNTGRFDRPYLGVQYQMLTERTATANNIPQGAYITEVLPGSPADEAGIQADDVITKFDGSELKTVDLATLINRKKIGDEVEVEIWRNEETVKARIRLRQRIE